MSGRVLSQHALQHADVGVGRSLFTEKKVEIVHQEYDTLKGWTNAAVVLEAVLVALATPKTF